MQKMFMLEGYYNSQIHTNHIPAGTVFEFSDEQAEWLIEHGKAVPYAEVSAQLEKPKSDAPADKVERGENV